MRLCDDNFRMSTIKTFKKGDVLFKEGDKAGVIYLIQSGSVSLQIKRQKLTIELIVLGSNQIAGEHALSGIVTHPHSAVCTSETKVIELPADGVKAQLDTASQLLKFLTKGMSDKLKVVMKEFQSMKLEKDNTPCPADQTAKIFGTVYHVARAKGETKTPGVVSVAWPLMKQYAQRVFLESPKRLEQAVNIFVKLGLAKYEWAKLDEDPDAVEEISVVHFSDLQLVEQFFEFYQYYHFKGGKTELLKTDDRVIVLTQILLDLGSQVEKDRHGAVRIDYTKIIEKVKEVTGLQLNADNFTMLENKGLFVKRQSNDKGVILQFDFGEFERTLRVWRVLREVERWNEKGSVDPNEAVVEAKVKKAGPECSQCQTPYEGTPKFCSHCGAKISQAA